MFARLCTALAVLALLCIVGVVVLSTANQSLRQQVSDRQQTINQGLTLSQLNSRLINTLANLSSTDEQLRKILTDNGITIKVDPPASVPSAK
jgi:maltose-binding protein MalE